MAFGFSPIIFWRIAPAKDPLPPCPGLELAGTFYLPESMSENSGSSSDVEKQDGGADHESLSSICIFVLHS